MRTGKNDYTGWRHTDHCWTFHRMFQARMDNVLFICSLHTTAQYTILEFNLPRTSSLLNTHTHTQQISTCC